MGAAAAVARGVLTLDFVAASLAVPARCSLPLAPPHPLLLSGCSFMPFPTGTFLRLSLEDTCPVQGPVYRLSLRSQSGALLPALPPVHFSGPHTQMALWSLYA